MFICCFISSVYWLMRSFVYFWTGRKLHTASALSLRNNSWHPLDRISIHPTTELYMMAEAKLPDPVWIRIAAGWAVRFQSQQRRVTHVAVLIDGPCWTCAVTRPAGCSRRLFQSEVTRRLTWIRIRYSHEGIRTNREHHLRHRCIVRVLHLRSLYHPTLIMMCKHNIFRTCLFPSALFAVFLRSLALVIQINFPSQEAALESESSVLAGLFVVCLRLSRTVPM